MPRYHSLEAEGSLLITAFVEKDPVIQLLIRQGERPGIGIVHWIRKGKRSSAKTIRSCNLADIFKDQGFDRVIYETIVIEGSEFAKQEISPKLLEAMGFRVSQRKHRSEVVGEILEEERENPFLNLRFSILRAIWE